MKTTKKGFTLIELIVVIAIIGVLAAILVPTMLGYVKKSKLSSATTTASSIQKAVNTALVELDEEGNLPADGTLTLGSTGWTASDSFSKKVAIYFKDISKVSSGDAMASIKGGTCVAVAVKMGAYVGTVPTGVVTTDNYESYGSNLSAAFSDAVVKANS